MALGAPQAAFAADVPPPTLRAPVQPSAWQFRFTPYIWLINISGEATARNQTVDANTTFFDIVQKSTSLLGWMSYAEARKDALALYADVIWGQFKFSGDGSRYRNPVAGLSYSASLGANAKFSMAIIEAGAAYELARWGAGPHSHSALDIVAGARYWNMSVDLAFAITGVVNVEALGLERSGNLAIARSGTMQWVDPLIGANFRHQFAPGKEFRMRADIGGFSVGSKLTWQLFGGYSQEFKVHNTTMAWVLGYRAISVDYRTESGTSTRGLDMILHGPVAGLSFRW